MTTTPETYARRLEQLRTDLVEQSRRVQSLIEASFDALFAGDATAGQAVVDRDDVIDRVDVQIEQASVALLEDVADSSVHLTPSDLRAVLTIVKINNELERIADAGVSVAEHVAELRPAIGDIPDTFRVMANSVIGILRDAATAYHRRDIDLARLVLQSEDTVEQFKAEVLRVAAQQIAASTLSVQAAFALHEIANRCEVMADHSTNIAEQVIYANSGAIVRHLRGHWEDVPES